jgi:ATP-dependent RNA helicase DDX56/DBP9
MLAATTSGGGGGDAQQAAAAAGAAAESDTDDDEAAAARAAGTSTSGGPAGGLQPHQRLTKAAVEGLRYRAEDVARSITRNVIKEARAKELKNELLNSQRLAAFFEEHPSGECGWVGG